MFLFSWKQFNASLDGSVGLQMLLCMQLKTIVRVLTYLCDWKCSNATGNNFMQVWTNLCNRKCSNAAGNDFMQVWTNLCNRKCSYTTGNDFMRVWTNPCDRESFSVTNCWQELHFEFSRQNLNQNVQSPPMLWWLIKQSRPIWKKASPGLQRPSRTESTSGLTSSTPRVRTHTLDPTLDAPSS